MQRCVICRGLAGLLLWLASSSCGTLGECDSVEDKEGFERKTREEEEEAESDAVSFQRSERFALQT